MTSVRTPQPLAPGEKGTLVAASFAPDGRPGPMSLAAGTRVAPYEIIAHSTGDPVARDPLDREARALAQPDYDATPAGKRFVFVRRGEQPNRVATLRVVVIWLTGLPQTGSSRAGAHH